VRYVSTSHCALRVFNVRQTLTGPSRLVDAQGAALRTPLVSWLRP
jgi:hypothetical protein